MAQIADVSNVGNVLAGTASVTGVVTMSAIFIIYHLANQYTDMLNMQMSQFQYAVTGDLIALVFSQLAAAYAAVQAIDAVSKTGSGFFYNYRGGSVTGDLMGLYELFASLSYLTWTLVISLVGYIAAGLIFQQFVDREEGVVTQGSGGKAFGANDGYKYLALGAIIGGGSWVASVALGDSATKLLGFFDNYDTKSEGYNYDGSQRDTDGTSIGYDLTFHVLSLIMYHVVASAIWLGGIIFGFVHMTPNDDYECLFDQSVKDKYTYVTNEITNTTEYNACLKSVEDILANPKYAEQKGYLSRCENAQVLYTFGNTAEYSKKYARSYTQPQLQQLRCSKFKK